MIHKSEHNPEMITQSQPVDPGLVAVCLTVQSASGEFIA